MNFNEAVRESIGEVVEAFVSIQGEGIFVGVPMAFFRLARCSRRCLYCDTAYAWTTPEYAVVRKPFSNEVTHLIRNPADACAIVEALSEAATLKSIKWACITGGEPLLQPSFCVAIASQLREIGMRILLETQGDLYEPLGKVMPFIDAVSADAKLPSTTGEPLNWDSLRLSLKLCKEFGCIVYIKLVVTPNIDIGEVMKAVALVSSVDAQIPFVLQPVTPMGSVKEGPSKELLWQIANLAAEQLHDVRIIPQVHRMLKLP